MSGERGMPAMTVSGKLLCRFVMLGGLLMAQRPPYPLPEVGINRPGGDYTRFSLQKPDARECQRACFEDARCKAFTYVRPGVQGPDAQCWLKSAVPRPVRDPNCVSGIKPAPR
jgi:hypothetical protein